MWNEVQWIKIPDMELRNKQILHGDLGGRFAYFRLEQELPADARLTARITAVSRYRLWVNDQAVLSGSCKGDLNRQYYETVSLTPYLHAGKNVFAVQVLYNDPTLPGIKRMNERPFTAWWVLETAMLWPLTATSPMLLAA